MLEITTEKLKTIRPSLASKRGTKNKNLLTSLLRKSSAKKHQPKNEMRLQTKHINPEGIFQPSNESNYSTIEDSSSAHGHRKTSLLSLDSPVTEETQNSPMRTRPRRNKELPMEPVYAVVHKPPVKPERKARQTESNSAALLEMKENNKILQQRLKELSEENIHLKKQLQDAKRQEELEEANFHSKLQLEITQLEAETRKEVKSLSDRITILAEEKNLLSQQIDLLHQEGREAQARSEALVNEARKKVDPDFHTKTVVEYRRLLDQTKLKCEKELGEYKENFESLSVKKLSLEATLQERERELNSSLAKIEELKKEQLLLREEKARHDLKLEESKQLEKELQKLLLSLLKVADSLTIERDILLNKTSFQESQQKELQSSVVGYSLNIGRLQEHVKNLNKENLPHLLELQSKNNYREESVHEYYTQQLDILREKIVNQNNTIMQMESEKRQMEMQLQNKWESFL